MLLGSSVTYAHSPSVKVKSKKTSTFSNIWPIYPIILFVYMIHSDWTTEAFQKCCELWHRLRYFNFSFRWLCVRRALRSHNIPTRVDLVAACSWAYPVRTFTSLLSLKTAHLHRSPTLLVGGNCWVRIDILKVFFRHLNTRERKNLSTHECSI